MKKIGCIFPALLLSLAIGCATSPETDSPAPAPSADTNKWLRPYASPGELQAIRQSIDPESPAGVNLHQHSALMSQKGFVHDGRGWRRVGTSKSSAP